MSSIYWDDQQMVALLAWLEDSVTLVYGEVMVQSVDIPQEAFAAEVDLERKQFRVFVNPENPTVDTSLNVFLGYILALSYDRSSWSTKVPTEEDLIDCHRLVCEAMIDFNLEFSIVLEDHLSILELWRKRHEEDKDKQSEWIGATPTTTDELVYDMGNLMFGNEDKDDEWGIN